MIITGNKAMVGRENIKAYYSAQLEQIDGNMERTIVSIDVCADVAIERGTWRLPHAPQEQSGRYLTQWKWINGSWLTQLDVSYTDE